MLLAVMTGFIEWKTDAALELASAQFPFRYKETKLYADQAQISGIQFSLPRAFSTQRIQL